MPLMSSRAAELDLEVEAPRQSAPILIAALRAKETEAERREAAFDLHGVADAAAALVAALRAEESLSVREAIISALLSIGNEVAASGLASYLPGPDVALRNAAIRALRQMGEAAGAEVERLLASPDPDRRLFAVNVLEGLPHPKAMIWLRGVLVQDREVNVGLAVVEALALLGAPEDVVLLRAFSERFAGEPWVKCAVDMACRRVAGGRA